MPLKRVLEVLPKVDDTATSAEDCRGVLLRLLSRTERFAHFRHQAAGQHLRRMPLLEVFITAFFDNVASLARGGLLRQYQEQDDELQLMRGRQQAIRRACQSAGSADLPLR